MAPRRYDAETQLLHPSKAEFKERRPTKLATLVLRLFSALGLVELTVDVKTGEIESTTNLTLLNVFLLRLGPMREDSLTRVLIATQVSGGLFLFNSSGRLRCNSVRGRVRGFVILRFAYPMSSRDGQTLRECRWSRTWLTRWRDRSRCAVACLRSSSGMAWLGSCTMGTGGREQ